MTPFDRLGVWVLALKVKRLNRLIRQLQRIDPMSPALAAAVAAVQSAASNVTGYVTQLQSDQDDSSAVTELNAVADSLNSLVPVAVSPATATGAVGQALSGTLAITGGVGPYTASSSAADVTVSVNGSTVAYEGTPAAAEDVTITVADSKSKTATATLTIS